MRVKLSTYGLFPCNATRPPKIVLPDRTEVLLPGLMPESSTDLLLPQRCISDPSLAGPAFIA